jgi:hypothetical protein
MNDHFHINTTVHRGTFGEDFEGSSQWLNFKAGGFEENHEKPLSG